jgi:bifunctional enzyme CysN/CysC
MTDLHSSLVGRQDVAGHGLLRFLTCGSVDDGKSTLIGRLLYDSKLIFDDQMSSLEMDSRKHGTTGEDIDLALLVDGLEAEREQGITIDVAYRFFSTPRRSFIVADTPGHEQYTRNMATGASNSDLAIILIDARKGVLTQTKRHSFICSLLGIRHVVVALNKIDLVDYSEEVFRTIVEEYRAFAKQLRFESMIAIPMSARFGDNVTARSDKTDWYDGPTLIEYLETIDVEADLTGAPFRFPVQWVNRPNLNFRGFSGQVASGSVRIGDSVAVAVSGRQTTVAQLVTADGEIETASAGDAITIVLADEVDISRGDVLCPSQDRPVVADQFAAHVLWMSEEPLLPGRSYLMRIGTRWVPVSVTAIKHRIDVNSLDHLAAKTLELNEIAFCNLSAVSPIAFDPYEVNRQTGAFILVDRHTNKTAAAGMIAFELRRATNIHRENLSIDRVARSEQKHQKPAILWFTGLSGSGKSTIAKLVEKRLYENGQHTYVLDGDNLRHGLNRDLGFTEVDRVENIRRVGEVAKLFIDSGLIVLCSFISPFRADRQMVRELVDDGDFIEIFVDTPIEECVRRDPKGLYAKAASGQIKNFTGFDSPYEEPETPDLRLQTMTAPADVLAGEVLTLLRKTGKIV